MDPILLTVLGLCLLASVFFTVAQTGLLFFSRARLEQRIRDERKLEHISGLLSGKPRLLLAAETLNELSNILFVLLVSIFLVREWPPSGIHLIEALAWSLGGVLIVGDILPRAWARRCPEISLIMTLRTTAFFAVVLKYPLMLLELLGEVVTRVFGAPSPETENGELEDQIRSAVSESEMEGEIREEEKEMFESIFDFRDRDVAEVMTPRTDMECVEVSSSIQEALDVAIDKGFSRLPVFEENRDNIVGLLYVKDLLKLWGKPDSASVSLREVLRKPMYVPETKQVGELLREMQAQRMHMAIVLDEYGGTAGLITVEDIVEEIVGEIQDEYDRVGELPMRKIDSHTMEVDAKVHIEDVNEELDTDLPEDEEYDTIAGFLFSHMGKVPSPGEQFSANGVTFTILDADERRIKSVRIVVSESTPEQQPQ